MVDPAWSAMQEYIRTGAEPPRLDIEEGSRDKRRLSSPMRDGAHGLILIDLPDRQHRKARSDNADRGMQPDAARPDMSCRQRGEGGTRQRLDIGCVIGASPRIFEPRHVGEIGQRCSGIEFLDEGRERLAVMDEERRDGRLAQHEAMGHGVEELIADEALHHGKPRAKRLDQAHRDIVAIDGKTPVGPSDAKRP